MIYAAVERFATGINTQVIKCLRSVSPTACQNSAEILAQEACVQQKSYEESGMHRSRPVSFCASLHTRCRKSRCATNFLVSVRRLVRSCTRDRPNVRTVLMAWHEIDMSTIRGGHCLSIPARNEEIAFFIASWGPLQMVAAHLRRPSGSNRTPRAICSASFSQFSKLLR